MSAFLRGALCGACLIGTFLAGYVLRNPPKMRSEPTPVVSNPFAEKPVVVPPRSDIPPTKAPTTDHVVAPPPPIQLVSNSKEAYTPKIDFDKLSPSLPDLKGDFDPKDLAFQIVKKELGINTKILGDSEPVPAVLAEARKNDVPPPGMDPTPLMVGPAPRFELPPPLVIDVPDILPSKLLVKDRSIALDFEITRIGFSKIVAVELWTTRDEGKTWQKTDRQEGCESPFRTRLWSEGHYGFKMVFESETGMKTPEPKAGQNRDFGVILDATAPKVTLHRLSKSDLQPRTVTIGWSSIDERLDHSFVRIEYSLNGIDWNEIPDVKPRSLKTGFDFNWSMPEDLPPRLQLRVTTRDQAGNYGMAQTAVGAIIDLVEPAGKITGIRDESVKPEVGPMPREVNTIGSIPRLFEPRSPSEAGNALLSSLVLLEGQPTEWDTSGNEPIPEWTALLGWTESHSIIAPFMNFSKVKKGSTQVEPFLVKKWLADLTNTTVAEDSSRQLPPFRRNSFEQPAVDSQSVEASDEACELLCSAIWAGDEGYIDPRTGAPVTVRNHLVGHEGPVNPNNVRKRSQLESLTIHDCMSRGQTIMKLTSDRTWKPSTATPQTYRVWEYKVQDPRGFWGSFSSEGLVIRY